MDMTLTFKQDDTMFEIDAIDELANFILKIDSRILAKDQSNKEFFQIILAHTKLWLILLTKICDQDLWPLKHLVGPIKG